MQTFVVIFRQGPLALTDADKQRRSQETAPWARQCNDAGHRLEARILAPEAEHRGPQAGPGAAPVTALLFLEARDLREAAEIAGSHPALRYGSSVEVRAWAPPPLQRQPD